MKKYIGIILILATPVMSIITALYVLYTQGPAGLLTVHRAPMSLSISVRR